MANLILSDRPAAAVRAAVYARFSTDRQSEESIADQVRVCTEHAARAGWTVTGTYADEGISGAALGNRPGVKAALDAVGGGDVLLVTDLSRLSRSQDLAPLLARLRHRGVRIIGTQDGFDSNSRTARMQAGLSGIMSEEFRAMVADRTFTALESRAKDARPTGGKAFGYVNKNGDRAIDPEQAEIIREIFTRYAAGESQKAIAVDLNRRGIPSPGATWNRAERPTDGKWRVSALHAILHNEVYTGRQIWNRSKWIKDPDTGKRTAVERPRSEWIINERPDLALVDAETWQKVRTRDTTGYSSPRARPRYLLSGILLCDSCGGNLTIIGGGTAQRYVCSLNHSGGDAACSNRLGVPRLVAEELILQSVEERFVSDEAIAEMVAELYRIKSGQMIASATRPKVDPRIAELRRLVTSGILAEAEARPAIARLEAEAAKETPAIPDVDSIARTVKARALAYREALHGRAVSVARDVLRRLVGVVRCLPVAASVPGGKGYLVAHFERGTRPLPMLDFLDICSGKGAVGTLVAGAGFEPATFGL